MQRIARIPDPEPIAQKGPREWFQELRGLTLEGTVG